MPTKSSPALLTKKKKAWAAQFKPTANVKGTPLNYNVGVAARYNKELSSLIKWMTSETQREIRKLWKSPTGEAWFAQDESISSQARILTNALQSKFEQLFRKRSKGMASRMTANASKASKASLHASLKEMSGGLSLKTSVLDPDLKQVLKASIDENVALIRSIPSQYFTQIQGAVMRSITSGNGLEDLNPFMAKQEGVTLRRAHNIALDQTRKAYNNLNKGRMQAIGVNSFEWLHTGGSQHPREDHIELSGQTFSFDNLPVIDKKTGERGIPGQAINCRCRMVPVLPLDKGTPSDTPIDPGDTSE